MNKPDERSGKDSRSRPSGAGVYGAVFAAAVVLVVLVLFVASLLHQPTGREPSNQPQPAQQRPSVSPADPTPGQPRAPSAARTADPERPTPSYRPGAGSDEAPVGIHAFPPLGTRPQLTGIIVPEDFELPPGYVRHYQSTDDGQRLAPILMFDPRQPPLDEFGEPMDIPPDRIVPPEQAPAGMPIIQLELPDGPPEADPRSLRGLFRPG